MGRAYSVNGFINAALRRNGKTLLVEGSSDKRVMHRFCIEKNGNNEFVIDEASLISCADQGIYGNKEKVIKTKEVAESLSRINPKLKDTLAFLVDREWDEMPPGEDRLAQEWRPPTQEMPGFTTLGHSIENYGFRSDHIVEYLKMKFCETLKPGVLNLISDEFGSIITMASCLSLSLQESALFSRSCGLISRGHLELEPRKLVLNHRFSDALISRAVDESIARAVVDRTNHLVENYSEKLSPNPNSKWLPHGHIGDDIVWEGVAAYAFASGTEAEICERIFSEGKAERQRFMMNLLSKSHHQDIIPLPELTEWLTTPKNE